MKTLRDKGLDVSDASHAWVKDPNGDADTVVMNDEYAYECSGFNTCPCYSLADVIDKLHDSVEYIDVCFDMLCKLIDKGYITTKR